MAYRLFHRLFPIGGRRQRMNEGENIQNVICPMDGFVEVKALLPISNTSAKDNHCPTARSGHRVWTDGQYLYSIGGYNPDNIQLDEDDDWPLLREVWRLNLLTDVWQQLSVTGYFPRQMASFAMIPDKNETRLYIFGGTAIPFGNTASKDVHAFHLYGNKKWTWEKIECTGTSPVAGYGQAIVKLKNADIYIVGGTTGFEYNMNVHRLSISNDTDANPNWDYIVQGFPCDARYRHEAVVFDQKILVFGGGTRDSVFGLETLDAFDLISKEWIQVPTNPDPDNHYPVGRRCHALVKYENDVYIFGGMTGPLLHAHQVEQQQYLANDEVLQDVWCLNLNKMLWCKMSTTLPEAVFFHSAAVTPDGCIYSFGGVLDQNGKRRTNKVFRWWIRTPPLQYMAARTLLNSCPSLLDWPINELRKFGMPQQLARLLKNADLAA